MVDCSKNFVACDGILLGQYKGELCHQFFIVVIANGNGTVIISGDFFGVVSNACNAHIKHRYTVLISGDFKITGEAATCLNTRKLCNLLGGWIVTNEAYASRARGRIGGLCKIRGCCKGFGQTTDIKGFGIICANVCKGCIAIADTAQTACTGRSRYKTLVKDNTRAGSTCCARCTFEIR